MEKQEDCDLEVYRESSSEKSRRHIYEFLNVAGLPMQYLGLLGGINAIIQDDHRIGKVVFYGLVYCIGKGLSSSLEVAQTMSINERIFNMEQRLNKRLEDIRAFYTDKTPKI